MYSGLSLTVPKILLLYPSLKREKIKKRNGKKEKILFKKNGIKCLKIASFWVIKVKTLLKGGVGGGRG